MGYKVIAMGWHCFSNYCKFPQKQKGTTWCTKPDNDWPCRQEHCPVFQNGKEVGIVYLEKGYQPIAMPGEDLPTPPGDE